MIAPGALPCPAPAPGAGSSRERSPAPARLPREAQLRLAAEELAPEPEAEADPTHRPSPTIIPEHSTAFLHATMLNLRMHARLEADQRVFRGLLDIGVGVTLASASAVSLALTTSDGGAAIGVGEAIGAAAALSTGIMLLVEPGPIQAFVESERFEEALTQTWEEGDLSLLAARVREAAEDERDVRLIGSVGRIVIGGLLMATGLSVLGWALYDDSTDDVRTLSLLQTTVAGAGLLTAGAVQFTSPTPLETLADELDTYGARQRGATHRPQAEAPPERPADESPSVGVGGGVLPGGAVLTVGGRF